MGAVEICSRPEGTWVGKSCENDCGCSSGQWCTQSQLISQQTGVCYEPWGQGEWCGGSTGERCASGLFCIGASGNGASGTFGKCDTLTKRSAGDACGKWLGLWCDSGTHPYSGVTQSTTCSGNNADSGYCVFSGVNYNQACTNGQQKGKLKGKLWKSTVCVNKRKEKS